MVRRRFQRICTRILAKIYKRKIYKVAILFVAFFLVTYVIRCSTTKSKEFIKDLCYLYDQGKVAGNMCSKLCDEDKFRFSHCGNNLVGKYVIMMSCVDCSPVANVVLKSRLGLARWTQDNKLFFDMNEPPKSLISRNKEAIYRRFKLDYGVDLINRTDSLSFVWQQNFDEFVNAGDGGKEGVRTRLSAGLQSLLALAKQEEYGSRLMLHNTDYIPRLYGSCGPAYFVEYTPSLPYLGYILYQGKLPQILSVRPKMVQWADRARAALQMMQLFKHIENRNMYMCDIKGHNFGINSRQQLTILDTDDLLYREISRNKLCSRDADCDKATCEGSCNLTHNICHTTPVNSHLQVVCRNIFLSDIPMFGLLRGPPGHVRDELGEALRECVSSSEPGHSDGILFKTIVEILERSLSR